jgi:hypothetical protein
VAIASFVLSIVAIVVALLSALYTRSQAIATTGLRRIEDARRLEERRPRLSGIVDSVAGRRGRLVITLDSDEPLSAVELTISSNVIQGIAFDRNVYGVWPLARPGQPALNAFTYGLNNEPAGIQPRASASWAVDIAEEHVDTLQLEATCHGPAGERWDAVLIRAPVQPDISKTVR